MPDSEEGMKGLGPRIVTAPDATAAEREVAEVLARGPQPPEDRVAKIQALAAETHSGESTTAPAEAMAEHVREIAAEPPPAPREMSATEAMNTLHLMLSTKRAPEPAKGWFELPRLTAEVGSTFKVQLRGLADGEMAELGPEALRKPTDRELEAGAQGSVQDTVLLNKLTIERAMLNPSLKDPELLRAYGPTAVDIINKWFAPGEIDTLAAHVSRLSQYSDGAVLQAKE